MTVDVSDLYKQFDKKEVIKIAEELGLDAGPGQSVRVLTNNILDNINEEGVPDVDDEDCSELMLEFLYTADYVDEDGNYIEKEDDEQIIEEDDAQVEEDDINEVDQRPDCFSFADKRDPACKHCSLLVICGEERLASRPHCFGKLYDDKSEECKVCIEAPSCQNV